MPRPGHETAFGGGGAVAGARRGPLVLLEAATLLSGTGNGVATVALPWLILERTGSATAAGVVAAGTTLPLLLSSLFSGTVVDLVGRRRVSMLSDLLSLGSVVAIPLVDAAGGLTVPALVGLALLGALFDPAGITAREAMLPSAADVAGIPRVRLNGVHEAVWAFAFLIGPGVGGVLIAAVGATGALWVTAAGFVLSIALVGALRLPGAGRPLQAHRPEGLLRGTREGLVHIAGDPLLRTLAVLSVAVIGVYLPVEGVLLPVWFQQQGAPERLGLLVGTMAAGGAGGALLFGAVGHRLPRRPVFLASLIGACAALVAMALLPPYPLLVALGGVVGFCYGPVGPLVSTALQARTPEHLRGRAVGVVASTEYAAGPVGYLAAGPLIEQLGVRSAFLVLATVLLAIALSALGLRSLRAFDDDRVPEPVA